ncbi:MAG: hypothetical protein NZ750_04010 [Anaerolineae bacterium]|nr:hypothetical protein [Anaerolineae bacterium]MDW8171486.1 hypothetical protein [Anaerolineae bacterium]
MSEAFANLPIRYSTLHDGMIMKFVIDDVSRATVDAWYNFLTQRIGQWDEKQPYLVLYDLRDRRVSMTPYLRERAAVLNALRPEVSGRIAILINRSATSYLMMAFARLRSHASRQARIFFVEGAAVQWLEELLED